MEFEALYPCIRFAMPVRLRTYPREVLAYDHRLFYCAENTFIITAGGADYPLSPGDMLFLPPALPYRFTCAAKEASVLLFNFDLDLSCFGAAPQTPQPTESFLPERLLSPLRMAPFDQPLLIKNASFLEERLRGICALFTEEPPLFAELASAEMKYIILRAAALHRAAEKNYPRILDQVKGFLDQNFLTPPSNAAIAEKFGYHPYYLNQLFFAQFGNTLHSYIIHKKLRLACTLLLSTDMSIGDIAAACAFSGAAWFSETFKHSMGVSPSEYRRRAPAEMKNPAVYRRPGLPEQKMQASRKENKTKKSAENLKEPTL